ncbi:MAG: pectinesterase family protein, partial [Eubacteriales bacterium]|nr:pectinesterase family protein [Eubacteriales bacterium]
MKRQIMRRIRKITSLVAATAMTTMLFSGISFGYAAEIKEVTHTYDFTNNAGKAVPVKGQILDKTDSETTGILYSEESTNNVTFDAAQLKFRNGSVLYLPISDDTTKITYSQSCTGDSNERPTYVGENKDTYMVQMKKTEQSVTINDITDYIKTVGDKKYIAIYSHGDVKIAKIKLTEYNPVNRVTVTGNVEGAAQQGITQITFKNMDSGELTTANIEADGAYSVVLKRVETTAYTASVSKTGYQLDRTDNANQFTLTGNDAQASYNFKVVEAPVTNISGTLTGVPDSACKADLGMRLIPDDSTLNSVDVVLTKSSDGVYTFADVNLTPDMTYSCELINANDYEVNDKLLKAEGTYTDLSVKATAKPVYDITGSFVTSNGTTADVTSITFTNMNEAGYSYTFEAAGNGYTAKLRAGDYVTSAQADGYTVFDHVSVGSAAQVNDIYLEAPQDTTEAEYKEEILVGENEEFKTIQSAINYVKRMKREAGERVTLKLNDALYREQIIVDTPDITFATDRTEAPVVTWYYGIGYSYYSVAPESEPDKGFYSEKYAVDKYEKTAVTTHWGTTVEIKPAGSGFRAEGITFESSFNRYMTTEEIEDGVGEGGDLSKDNRSVAGVDVQANKNKERACAMYIVADNCEYKNCSFLSSQDTMFTGDGEENIYFKDCLIEGTTDFICGNGNPVFDGCTLSIYGYSDKAADGSFITASKAGGSKGYLFNNCKVVNTNYPGIMPGTKNVYFGRPWGAGTKVLFYNTEVESADMIHAAGYAPMSNVTPAEAFYSEYNTHTAAGVAVDTSRRAAGSKVLSDAEASQVSVKSYFGDWTPSFYSDGGTDKPTQPEEPSDKIIAFPGAEGGGMYATGGRGGDVYTVTNLEDYKQGETPIEGSLRYGVETAGEGRIIVFNVAGTINLKQTLTFRDKKNITLAGQTAPGDGITIAGYDTNISNSENLIIRYLRFRPGAANVYSGGDSMDALWGRDNDTFIIDHCSFSWNTDETLSTYRGKDGTVQWCIISESLTVSGHTKGRHGYGGIFGGDNTVFQYNLIANHTSRSPRIGGGSMGDPTKDGGSMATLQISNNVVYNWGYLPCYGGGFTNTNYVNNYLKAGLGTRDDVDGQIIRFGESGKTGSFYVAGNVVEGNDELTNNNQKGVINAGQTSGSTITRQVFSPIMAQAFGRITLVSANGCYNQVLNKAGATFPERDAIDARVVSETINDTGFYINTEDEVGGYCTDFSEREEGFDTDKDGIADAWELENGLNPNDNTDSVKIDAESGYAYIELYINSLVEGTQSKDYAAPNPTASMDLANNTQVSEGTAVTVNVNAEANNGGSIAKVEFYNGSELVGTDESAPYSCDYINLTDGTYNISARAYDNAGNATQTTPAKLHVNSVADSGEWTSKDIGTTNIKGSSSLVDGVLTVKGTGKLGKSEGSVSGTEYAKAETDNFQFTYKQITGDIELVAKLDSATAVDNHVFSGIMFRESLDSDAKTAALGLSLVKLSKQTSWSTYLVDRTATGGAIDYIGETIDSVSSASNAGISLLADIDFKNGREYKGTWFKLARHGNEFTGYSSADGITWTKVGSTTIDMPDTIYIGFAVDSNKAANELDNLSTAKFSNISMAADFEEVIYNTANVDVSGAESVVPGDDLTAVFSEVSGFSLPETVEVTMNGVPADYTYDKTTGTLTVKNVTGKVVITAAGVKKEDVDITLNEIDDSNLLTIENKEDVMVLNQSATEGRISSTTSAAENASYLLFPETKDDQTLTLKLKVKNYSITGSAGKNTGVFVGAFNLTNNVFASLGFRGVDKTTDSLSPYWYKSSEKVGNGSPKFAVSLNDEYEVTFTRKDGVYSCSFKNLNDPSQAGEKIFTDSKFDVNDKSQLGICLIGADVEISDMKLTDADGKVIYSQAAGSTDKPVEPEQPTDPEQ